MDQLVLYVILGFGAGAAYALTGLGVVLVYSGSGVLNLSQGAIAMMAAFVCSDLHDAGLPASVAAVLAVGCAGVAGVLIYVVVMRPLRSASSSSHVIASLGILVGLDGLAVLLWTDKMNTGEAAPALLPDGPVHMFGFSVGQDRLWLLGIAVVLACALSVVYRRSRFGLASRAVAENERSAALSGVSPDLVAACNWAIGGVLAAIAGVFVAPISGLNVTSLTFVILPALAAAVVGRFTSFGVTATAGVLIGAGQSLITRYWSLQGMAVTLPLVAVVVAVALAGNRIPERGSLETRRPPLAADGRIKPGWAVFVPVAVGVALVTASAPMVSAITTSMIGVIIALSVVVVTGYVGQTNLAPLSFAAAGAFGASFFGYSLHIPFPLPLLLSAAVTIPIGVVIGLPALRVRGVQLAVVTLGVGIVMDAAVFQNYDVSGGAAGRLVPSPSIFGFTLDGSLQPVRFAVMVLVVLLAVTVLVSNVRRGDMGRKMLAVRSNERAAAAAGINVAAVKLYAFALSAGIASVAGGLLAYDAGATSANNFAVSLSLAAVALAFIGGIASISGAYQAGLLVSGGVVYVLLNHIGGISAYWDALVGLSLVVTIVTQPDGIALKNMQIKSVVMSRVRARRTTTNTPSTRSGRSGDDAPERHGVGDGASTPSVTASSKST